MNNDLKIKIDNTEMNNLVFHTPIFDLKLDNNTNIVKLHAPNWVNIAVYNQSTHKWIMSRETRHGIGKEVIEFMSGTVEEGETAKEAAFRELQEEFGYGINNLVSIKKLYEENVNPAFMDNKITGFYIIVEGLPGEQNLDEGEDVAAHAHERIQFKNQGLISMHTLYALDQNNIDFRYQFLDD